jgi:hypothetical protein
MSIPALQRKMLFDDRSKQRFGFRHHTTLGPGKQAVSPQASVTVPQPSLV